MYELEKVSVDKGHISNVEDGRKIVGTSLTIINPSGKIVYGDLMAIEVGDQILVCRGMSEFVRTSPISKIMVQTDKSVMFKTTGSVYTLNEVGE